ncbi:X-linked interleukin-1 receptor accessory protein-like 2 [Larimichthys crocea]|uniref:X-linked interleukin-1 receptor accessory protein-like 2 n=1 Tax=Larimichthys crocea TaxID=215358 RepID=A0A6G0I4J8_LARCR|nr:X-linked interleukin-1 receptor accessory protein-like 2 [Larimichthys crocea]
MIDGLTGLWSGKGREYKLEKTWGTYTLQTTQPPKVLFPPARQDTAIEITPGMPLSLDCKAFFGYSGENREPIIYWMKGEKFVEELAGHIKESEVRILREHLGEKEVQLSLTFDAVEEADLANYTCYAREPHREGQRECYTAEERWITLCLFLIF